MFRFIQFKLNSQNNRYEPIVFNVKDSHKTIVTKYAEGLSHKQVEASIQKYGFCEIFVPRKGVFALLVGEVLNPFYLFQIWAMALWFYIDYTTYASIILFISVISATT